MIANSSPPIRNARSLRRRYVAIVVPAARMMAVADRVAARVVDLLEVVEVEDRQRQRLVVAGRGRPRALHLLLECPVVAEPRQGVAQGLRASPVVGVLEDAPGLLEPLGRFEHATCQPDGQQAEDDGEDRARRAPAPAARSRTRARARTSSAPRWRSGSGTSSSARGTAGAGRVEDWSTRRERFLGSARRGSRTPVAGAPGCRTVIAARGSPADEHRGTGHGQDHRGHQPARRRAAMMGRVHPVCRRRRSHHRRGDRRIAGAPGRSALPLGAADRARDARPGPAVLDVARAASSATPRRLPTSRRTPSSSSPSAGTWRSRGWRSC